MKRKTPKIRRVDRDIFGTPLNRAKTWGSRQEDIKKNRRSSKKQLGDNINDLQ